MRDFCQFFLVTVMCLVVIAGCGLPAMPPREPITFDYVPETEAAPGSADVTFVVVGTQLAKPDQQTATQATLNVQAPLFDDFSQKRLFSFSHSLWYFVPYNFDWKFFFLSFRQSF